MIFGNAWVPTQNLFYHLGLKMVVFVLPTETFFLDSSTFCINHEYLQLSPFKSIPYFQWTWKKIIQVRLQTEKLKEKFWSAEEVLW